MRNPATGRTPAGEAEAWLRGPARGLLVVAHPGEELLGASAVLGRGHLAGIVYITDGAAPDGRDAARAGLVDADRFAAVRRAETTAALRAGGIEEAPVFLGHRDQTAAFHLTAITRQIATVLDETEAGLVVTPAFAGRHPDEDATAFAVHAAVAARSRAGGQPPALLEFFAYSAEGDTPSLARAEARAGGGFLAWRLSPPEVARRQAMLDCHRSQQGFASRPPGVEEHYRVAPAYDFTQPPPPGAPHYEQQPWGMSAAQWCELAREAAGQLGLERPVTR